MTHGGGHTDSAAFANLNTLKYVWNTGTFQWTNLSESRICAAADYWNVADHDI
jgi:hypothetical protein